MDPTLAFALGIVTLLMLAAPLALWQRRRLAGAEAEGARMRADVEALSEILAATPDGLYAWDHESGLESCSRRLAVLLDLAEGTRARFPDVLARFPADSARVLEEGVQGLRRRGLGFDLLLPLDGGRRGVQAGGLRTGGGAGEGGGLADLLWMRDVTGNADILVEDAASRPEAPGAHTNSGAGTGAGTEGGTRESLGSLLDSLPMPVWLRDGNLELVFANRASRAAGVSEPTLELARQAQAAGGAMAERLLVTAHDGPKLMEVTETPVEGWPGILGFAIDRSAAEELEGELARHVAARDQVLDNLSTAIAIFGPDARLVFFNTACLDLWGLEEAWLAEGPDHGELLARLREARRLPEVADFKKYREEQLALFGTVTEPVESLLHLPDGATIRMVVSPHYLGGLVFSYEDVTDRLDLERNYNTLIAVQGETLDNLYEGVAVFGSDGRLKLHNPVFAELWNLAPEVLAESPHVTGFVDRMEGLVAPDEDWDDHRERVIARLMLREPSSGRMMRTDGRVVDYANVPLPDGAVLLSYLDVTDTIRVELALRERAEALQEADRLKSEFIANVSYEIRTPLNTIIGFADILAHEYFGELSQRQQDYIRGIQDSSGSLMGVVNDILDLAAIEAGQLTLELDTVDLHGMLVTVLGLVRERARQRSLHLEFDCPPDIGWIVADEKRLKQVVFNLLSNAIDFTPVRGRVALSAVRDGADVVIAVADNGGGIAAEDQEKVFDAFERGPRPPDGSQGGAGLGLSLVKRFVELHGGGVVIRSRKKKGTTVTVTLPGGE